MAKVVDISSFKKESIKNIKPKNDAYGRWEIEQQCKINLANTTNDCLSIFYMAPYSKSPGFTARKQAITKAMILSKSIKEILETYRNLCLYYEDSDLISQCEGKIDEIFMNKDALENISNISAKEIEEMMEKIPKRCQIAQNTLRKL